MFNDLASIKNHFLEAKLKESKRNKKKIKDNICLLIFCFYFRVQK